MNCNTLQFKNGGEYMKNNLRVILAKKRKKISDVFEGTGISKTTLTSLYYEKNVNPSFNTLKKIADYLNVKIDDIISS